MRDLHILTVPLISSNQLSVRPNATGVTVPTRIVRLTPEILCRSGKRIS